MAKVLILAAVAVLAAVVSAHAGHDHEKKDSHDHDYGYGKYPAKEEKCYKLGQRCKGAYNHPYVDYYPCCDKHATCTGKDKYYGYVCELKKDYDYEKPEHYPKKKDDDYKEPKYDYPKKKDDDYKEPKYDYPKKKDEYKEPKYEYPKKDYDYPKCRPEGDKCIGAYGYPAVKWIPCCAGYTCTGKAKDWGYVCEKDYFKYPKYAPKCRPAGDKCIGAYGYPAIKWIPCCHGYSCTGKAKDWGKICVKDVKDYKEYKDYKAPPPKCSVKDCGDYKKCCAGYKCVAKAYEGYGKKEYYCKKVEAKKCNIKKCYAYDKKCCPGYECKEKPYVGYGEKEYYCEAVKKY